LFGDLARDFRLFVLLWVYFVVVCLALIVVGCSLLFCLVFALASICLPIACVFSCAAFRLVLFALVFWVCLLGSFVSLLLGCFTCSVYLIRFWFCLL